MAEPVIASAVAIPESEEPSPPSPTSSLKRRQSSVSDNHNTTTKRPRLDTETIPDSSAPAQNNAASETPSADSPLPDSTTTGNNSGRPTDRRRSAIGGTEERTRNKRMFGGLLGHLAQANPSSNSAAQKQRGEIERKQQAKLKLQAEEREEDKRRKGEELLAIRRREKRLYDNQAMQTRHANGLNLAHFLKTKSEPILYYKPWQLLPAEEERIKIQVEEAQATVDKELKEFADDPTNDPDTPKKDSSRQRCPDRGEDQGDQTRETSKNPETVGSHTNHAASEPMNRDSTNVENVITAAAAAAATNTAQNESIKAHEDEHSGEVMEEDTEDTVIY